MNSEELSIIHPIGPVLSSASLCAWILVVGPPKAQRRLHMDIHGVPVWGHHHQRARPRRGQRPGGRFPFFCNFRVHVLLCNFDGRVKQPSRLIWVTGLLWVFRVFFLLL